MIMTHHVPMHDTVTSGYRVYLYIYTCVYIYICSLGSGYYIGHQAGLCVEEVTTTRMLNNILVNLHPLAKENMRTCVHLRKTAVWLPVEVMNISFDSCL